MSNFIVESDNITVEEGVTIESGFHFLHANTTIEIKRDARVISLRNHMCNLKANSPDMYTCMDNRALQVDRLEYNSFLSRFNEQFPGTTPNGRGVLNLEGMWETLRSNYSSYLMSLGDIKT